MGLEYTAVDHIPTIVQDLKTAFRSGLTKDLDFRRQQLKGLLLFFKEHSDDLYNALWEDLHKHKQEAGASEIALVVDECKYMLANLNRLAKPKYTSKRFMMNSMDKTYIRKEAKGVVAVLGAWNYPVNLLLMPVVGAIAAGNAVIIKPSEVSQTTASVISRYLPQYLDSRAYAVVNGGVAETTVLLEQQLDHIFYTGNGNVGKIVMAAASKHLTPVTLELGGKSPAVITPDADLDITVSRLIWGKFFNCGQTCVAPDYVLVSKAHVERLIVAIRNKITQYYGENPQKSDSYCRIVNHRQFDRLKAMIDAADPKSIVVGGASDRDDRYIAPTIISPVDPNDLNLMQQEIFGPILPIIPVNNMDEAIAIINSRDHPLALYVFSGSKKSYNHILDNTHSGGVLVNDTLMHLQEMSLPFGGVGPSGMGSYHGDKSFDTFTHERSTMVKSTHFENVIAVRYPPYNQDKDIVLSSLVSGLPSSIGAKIKFIVSFVTSTFRVLTAKQPTV